MNSNPLEPTDEAPPPRADELAGRLLDDGATSDSLPELSAADRRRVADLLWLDALLEHAQVRHAPAVESAVASVLTRLRDNDLGHVFNVPNEEGRVENVPHGRRRSRRWASLLVAAALVLIGIVWWQQAPNSAYAMVEQVYRAALSTTDRTYRVTLTSDAPAVKVKTATLTVRGGEKFAFEHTGPLGGHLWIGSNGRDFWFVPPVGPVLVADSEQFVGQWLNRSQADLPFLQLTTILERMRDHYELMVLPNEPIDASGPTMHHLRARRRSDVTAEHARLPETVELWADRQTGVLQRLILTRSHNSTRPGPQTITFDLTGEEPRAADFYDYSSHASNRVVVHLPDVPQTTGP